MTLGDRRASSSQNGDPLEYVRRGQYWDSAAARLCGPGTVATLRALAELPPGGGIVLVPVARQMPSAGHIAASLLLHVVCHSDRVTVPPARLIVVPDNISTREGYCSLRISASELRRLMDAWRVRAAAAGHSPGDHTEVEKALIRRLRNKHVLPDIETLHLFFPGFRYTTRDDLVSIGSRAHLRTDDHDPAVLFTDSLTVARFSTGQSYPPPDWILLDCRRVGTEPRIDEVEKISRSFPTTRTAWLLPGVGHHLFNKLRGRGAKVCWLETMAELPPRPLTVDGAALNDRVSWKAIAWHDGAADLDHLQALLFDARRLMSSRSPSESWVVFRLLRHSILLLTSLPVRSAYYDAAAVERYGVLTTRELLEELSLRALRLAALDPVLAAIAEEAHAVLAATQARADGNNQRQNALLAAVESGIGSGEGLMLAVHGRTMRTAVESFLAEALRTNLGDLLAVGITIETVHDLSRTLHGQRPRALWTTYSGASDLDFILSLDGTCTMLLLNRLEQSLLACDLVQWGNRADAAQLGTESLGIQSPGTRTAISELAMLARTLRGSATQDATARPPQDWERLFEDDIGSVISQRSPLPPDSPGTLRPAVLVTFLTPGVAAHFPERAILTVLRQGQEKPSEISLDELRAGDRVVFVDKTVGRTLYELMQDQLTQSPTVGAAAQLVGLWHRALAEGYRRTALLPDQLLQRLQGRGSKITTSQTVKNWVRGVVLGPEDLEDVDRFAAVLAIARSDPRILQDIKRSIAGLRNTYRLFAKIVYRTILTAGSGGQLSDAEERLLEEHGLTLRDIAGAVSIETVTRVATQAEPVPAQFIGIRIEQGH